MKILNDRKMWFDNIFGKFDIKSGRNREILIKNVLNSCLKLNSKQIGGAGGWVFVGLRIYKLLCNYDLRTLDGKKSKKMEKYRDFD